jgi:hypothetical protein
VFFCVSWVWASHALGPLSGPQRLPAAFQSMSLVPFVGEPMIPLAQPPPETNVQDSDHEHDQDDPARCWVSIDSDNAEHNKMLWQRVFTVGGTAQDAEVVVLKNGDQIIAVPRQNIIEEIGNLVKGCFLTVRTSNLAYNEMIWQFVRWNPCGQRVIAQNHNKVISVVCLHIKVIGPPPPGFVPSAERSDSASASDSCTATRTPPSAVSAHCAPPPPQGPPPALAPAAPRFVPADVPRAPVVAETLAIVPANVPRAPVVAEQEHAWVRHVEMEATEEGLGDDWRLNRWIPLPLMGNNSILVKKCDDPDYNLAMFPNLHRNGLEMWFRSIELQTEFRLEDFDYLKRCPAQHFWPWCCWCKRFLLPVEDHRCSKKHLRAKEYIKGMGAEYCRQWIIHSNSHRDM